MSRLNAVVPPEEKLQDYLASIGESPVKTGVKLMELLKRPKVTYTELLRLYGGEEGLEPVDRETEEQLDVLTRYQGYIEKQEQQVRRMEALEIRPCRIMPIMPPWRVFGWRPGRSWLPAAPAP